MQPIATTAISLTQVLGTQLFHKSNDVEFGTFFDALFTMFQVVTGDRSLSPPPSPHTPPFFPGKRIESLLYHFESNCISLISFAHQYIYIYMCIYIYIHI